MNTAPEYELLKRLNGVIPDGPAAGRPASGHGCAGLRGDPDAVRYHERSGGGRGLPQRRDAHRAAVGRPGSGQRGQADHVRRHPGPAGAGHHQPRVVGQRARRAALHGLRDQRRAAETLAHPDRPPALLPRPRLDDRDRRAAADVPAAAEHAPALSATRAQAWARRSPFVTSRRTPSGPSTRSTRTTCSCCRCRAADRRSG